MSTSLKPIKVWGRGGPNPPKVAILLSELDLPHEIMPIPFADVKTPDFIAINPNGRIPALYDPNTDLTLWESGAILEYLIERYDTAHRFSFPAGTNDAFRAKQWLYFQTTGQGPYYGQVTWFKRFHPETVPSAVERYVKEVNRVTGVLEGQLGRQKAKLGGTASSAAPWLVGDKFTFADLAFVPWQRAMEQFCDKSEYDVDNYPLVKEWLGRMLARDKVKAVFDNAQY